MAEQFVPTLIIDVYDVWCEYCNYRLHVLIRPNGQPKCACGALLHLGYNTQVKTTLRKFQKILEETNG